MTLGPETYFLRALFLSLLNKGLQLVKLPTSSRALGSPSEKRPPLESRLDPILGEERPLADTSKNVPEHWVGTQELVGLLREGVLLQGIIDVFWLENDTIVVLDYKTDRVHTARELIDRYETQLHLYADALCRIFSTSQSKINKAEKLIYSFRLDKVIEIEEVGSKQLFL